MLSVTLSVESLMLLAAMRDRASVSNAAMDIVTVMYPKLLDIGCLSHMFNLVGERFKPPTLNLLFTLWISLFAHSPKVKALWKEATGRAMSSYCKTWWWSRWEVMNQVLLQFGDIEPFLQRNEDVGASTRAKMLEILGNHPKLMALKMELACVGDVGMYSVNGTYRLDSVGWRPIC